ncbi:annexin B11-like [Daktulosphaira vitifoliae]|uniref:annexin B11-like n=1 Tax=Daktulosphaira vitifoliae TaxID=58002 RepID=UPI0021AA6434|nr:annexin B11-like [Daktulosphaira vitifoliae]
MKFFKACVFGLALISHCLAAEEAKTDKKTNTKRSYNLGYAGLSDDSWGLGGSSWSGYGWGAPAISSGIASAYSLGSEYGLGHHVPTKISSSDHIEQVSVPQPYAVPVTRHVPVSVPHPVPVEVPRAVPVHEPHPVPVTVNKPYPVEVPRAVPVSVPHPVAVEVNRAVPYPVAHPYPVEIKQAVPYSVPTPVITPVHTPVLATSYAAPLSGYSTYGSSWGSWPHGSSWNSWPHGSSWNSWPHSSSLGYSSLGYASGHSHGLSHLALYKK